MNTDRLHFALADLAEEVTPVDLRDRALRTSHRLGVQRAVATSATAVVVLGAATGTAFALLPRNTSGPAPADTPSVSLSSPMIPSPSVGRSQTPSTAPSTAAPATPSDPVGREHGLAAGLYYYVAGNPESKAAGQLWHRSPGGAWNREGRPAADDGRFVKIPSPDGRKVVWFDTEAKPIRLRVSNLDGSGSRTLGSFTSPTCRIPSWSGDGKQIVFGAYDSPAQEKIKIEVINVDGTDRRTLDRDATCADTGGTAVSTDAGIIAYQRDRQVVIVPSSGTERTVTPKLPSGLVVHDVLALSPDGRRALVSTHVPTPGECGCEWIIRNFVVDLSSGSTVELARIGGKVPANGTGEVQRAVFLQSGGLALQVNTTNLANNPPHYRLAIYAPTGRMLSIVDVPPGHPYGLLINYHE